MDLEWLKDFLALAEHGNFSRAADARHVTQPAFSRRIRALEDWIGTSLFARSAHGAALTPAGVYFRFVALEMTRTLDQARRHTRAIGERETMSLSIAATHASSFSFFPAWLGRHRILDKLGALNLISDSMEACEELMQAGDVHFLLGHYQAEISAPLEPERFASHCLGRDRLVALSAPDAHGDALWPLQGDAKRPTRMLGYSPMSGLGRILAAHANGSRSPEISGEEIGFTSHLAATLMTMACEGLGVVWLPLTLAEDEFKAGRLVRAGAQESDIPIEIRLFRSPTRRNPAADRLWALVEKVACTE